MYARARIPYGCDKNTELFLFTKIFNVLSDFFIGTVEVKEVPKGVFSNGFWIDISVNVVISYRRRGGGEHHVGSPREG